MRAFTCIALTLAIASFAPAFQQTISLKNKDQNQAAPPPSTPQFAPKNEKASKAIIAILADNNIKRVDSMKTPLANHEIMSDGTFITNSTPAGIKAFGAKVIAAYSVLSTEPIKAGNKALAKLKAAGFKNSTLIPIKDPKNGDVAFLRSDAFGNGGWMMIFYQAGPPTTK